MRPTYLVVSAALIAAALNAQTTTWTSFQDRRGHAMASTATGGVVMFGGESVTTPGEVLGDTNRLSTNNQTWTGASDGIGPRSEHAMAATVLPGQQQAYIVFGGRDPLGQPTNRTWRYNGIAWGDLTPLSNQMPTARTGHAMVTNTVTQTMLLIGGFDGTLSLNDVWELNPQTGFWSTHTAFGGPSPRYDHALAYHPGNGGSDGRVYLFGGTPFRNDMWEFDPYTDTWTNVTPATSPSGRRKSAMAYVDGLGTVVLFGGQGTGLATRNDTWSWDRATLTWTQAAPLMVPPGRFDHAVAADNTGDNLIMLGGTNSAGSMIEGTWAWNGVEWTEKLPSPSARDGAAMAYDSTRNRHVVFGGRATAGGADLDETWEIDGLNWRKRLPSAKPSPRSDAGMAFDTARNRTVLYGGRSQATGLDLGDTWEWNGSSWSPKNPGGPTPPLAAGIQPVFDATRGVVALGMGTRGTFPIDQLVMWWFDGTTWAKDVIPQGGPAVWDTARGRMVAWNGYGWTLAESWTTPPQNAPTPGRHGIAVVFDEARQEMLFFGGNVDQGTTVLNDTWAWNGTTWTMRTANGAPGSPPARVAQGNLGYDRVRQRVVMFGGFVDWNNRVALNDTWEWNGANWTQIPASPPAARWGAATTFDSVRSRVVMVGGSNQFTGVNDTIEWNGTVWTTHSEIGPFPFTNGGATYDVPNQRLVMFGGYGANGAPTAKTWYRIGTTWQEMTGAPDPTPSTIGSSLLFDGTNVYRFGGAHYQGSTYVESRNQVYRWTGQAGGWVLVDTAAPSSRSYYGAAYDQRRACMILFGGQSTGAPTMYNNETWEWDGDSWLQRFPNNAPSPRSRCKLTYDETRSRVVLYGGADATNTFQDTWEWDGANWIQQSPVANPPGSSTHDLTFDQSRRLTIGFGSFGTWDYGPVTAASITPYGTGCATSAGGVLTLKPLPWSGPWMGERLELDFQYQPLLSLGIFAWGFSNTASAFGALPVNLGFFGSPACFLRASADVTELIFPGTTRYTSFLLPNHPSFLGAKMYGQAGFFDAGAPGQPVVTSNGIEMVFGQK